MSTQSFDPETEAQMIADYLKNQCITYPADKHFQKNQFSIIKEEEFSEHYSSLGKILPVILKIADESVPSISLFKDSMGQ